MRQLCYNSLMLIVATASFSAFGGIDSIIEHTVVVSPNKAKNKAFRMEAGSAVCDLYLTPESPWAIRDSRITGRDDKTLWKKIDKAHYFMVYGYAVNEYVKIDGDLYKSGTGTGGAGTPEYPPFSVTVPKVALQWGERHGDASTEEKEDAVPALLVVSNGGADVGELIVKAPKDDFSMPSIKPKVTLTWDKGNAVRVFDGESEVKSGVTFMLMWGTEKHLSVRAVAPADKVKFTLEGEPDVVNHERAVDYVHAKCYRIKSNAYATFPSDHYRSNFGVGEIVNFTIEPEAKAIWSSNKGSMSPENSLASSARLKLSDEVGSLIFSARLENGTLLQGKYRVKEPKRYGSASVIVNHSISKGVIGVLMHVVATLDPLYVSFSRVQIKEVSGCADRMYGGFANKCPRHDASPVWMRIGSVSNDFRDFIGINNVDRTLGSQMLNGFSFQIPVKWKLVDSDREHDLSNKWRQEIEIDKWGTATVKKFGIWGSRDINDIRNP